MSKHKIYLFLTFLGMLFFAKDSAISLTNNVKENPKKNITTGVQQKPIVFKPRYLDKHNPKPRDINNFGGTRGFTESPLAIVPLEKSQILLSTLAAYPTFWIYLPKTKAKKLILTIKEKNSSVCYESEFSISGKSGIIGLKMSDNMTPLKIGSSYIWSVSIVNGNNPGPNDIWIESWIYRASLKNLPSQSSYLEQARWYSEQGIWYDALNSLTRARIADLNSNEIADLWDLFIKSVDLEQILNQPIKFEILN